MASQPFFTPEGIHILKVMDREETAVYENVSARLMERLRRKEILDKGTGAVLERLKKAWQYAPNQAAMEELLAKGRTEQTLFTIDGQAYTGTMFTHFASSHPQAVKRQLEGFIAKSLLDYESRNIDKKHPVISCGQIYFLTCYLFHQIVFIRFPQGIRNFRMLFIDIPAFIIQQ